MADTETSRKAAGSEATPHPRSPGLQTEFGELLRSLVSLNVLTPSTNKVDARACKVAGPGGGDEDAELKIHVSTHLFIHAFNKLIQTFNVPQIYFYKFGVCFVILWSMPLKFQYSKVAHEHGNFGNYRIAQVTDPSGLVSFSKREANITFSLERESYISHPGSDQGSMSSRDF